MGSFFVWARIASRFTFKGGFRILRFKIKSPLRGPHVGSLH